VRYTASEGENTLRDRIGRRIDYLRLSVTDRCNRSCAYCRPPGSAPAATRPDPLAAAEIEAVARAAAFLGFSKFRLTGGEPTLRPDIVEIVERLARIDGVRDLSMTTNAARLVCLARPLARAGLTRVNVHVDSARPAGRATELCALDEIEAGLAEAEAAGLAPIKLNCVVTRGSNEQDVVSLARHALAGGWHARFIEAMPVGNVRTADLACARFVPSAETRATLESALGPLHLTTRSSPADSARTFRVAGRPGVIGFIRPVSAPVCASCNRMRLTAEGKLQPCLLHDHAIDLRPALRSGSGIDELATTLARAVRAKPPGHQLRANVSTRAREMYQIGG
jgi:cyclic pyranopterin phosphate synthase